jgi:hypothetical protein
LQKLAPMLYNTAVIMKGVDVRDDAMI